MNWREVIDRDWPEPGPITEEHKRVSVDTANYGTYYAAHRHFERTHTLNPRLESFFSGLMGCMGLNYQKAFTVQEQPESSSYLFH